MDVQAAWRRRLTYGRASNAIDILQGSLRYLSNTGPICQSSHNWTPLWHNGIWTPYLRMILIP